MKKTARHITVFLLAGMVALSSVGLSIHHMYCYCKGELKASLFCISDPCDMAISQQESGCCDGGTCHQPGKPEQHECSDCNTEYVKLDVTYLVLSSDFKLHPPVTAFLPAMLKAWITVFDQPVVFPDEDPSPPPAGKALLPWVQSFLC